MVKNLMFIVAALVASATCAQPAAAADTVFVMRHLQKAEGNDPPLSAEGSANAQILVGILAGKGIKAIFATPTQRAMQTGEPLAKALRIAITSYDPRDPAALVKATVGITGAVLIIGHSNTVPDIVARLGGAAIRPLGDQDYGTIFVVRSGSDKVEEIVLTGSH